MSESQSQLEGPDLGAGVAASELTAERPLLGHAQGEAIMLARVGNEVLAIGASCTHYGGPLAKGIVVGDTVRCPLHHACFSLRTGEALRAPALDPVTAWEVEQRGDRLFVIGKKEPGRKTPIPAPADLARIVIVGGGAAGLAAAEMLRREGYAGSIAMLSAEASAPCDRPNLSKDYLAGNAPDEWIPLRPEDFYEQARIDLALATRVTRIDVAAKRVETENGSVHPYDALLIATGADPVKLPIPGSDLPHVHTLRSWNDSRAIRAGAASAKQAVVIGASFIGLEVAASLRKLGLEVHVVAPETRPLERVLGPELGDFVRKVHEEHGVQFHLGRKPQAISATSVTLDDGSTLAAALVVTGVGVRPGLGLAESAGLAVDRGIVVNEYLETSQRGIFAAGDAARFPDPRTGERIRVEHWVVAERLGQIAARNILGRREPARFVPFFWSRHYDVGISYVGHAERWDAIEIEGEIAKRRFRVNYRLGGRIAAVASVGIARESLRAELALEKELGATSP